MAIWVKVGVIVTVIRIIVRVVIAVIVIMVVAVIWICKRMVFEAIRVINVFFGNIVIS